MRIMIKVWDEDKKEMINSEELESRDDINIFASYGEIFAYRNLEDNPTQLKVLVGTNLNDKSGKEIYEGDIIKARYFKPLEVTYSNCSFRFGNSTLEDMKTHFSNLDFEVIGNIYENQDLLNNQIY